MKKLARFAVAIMFACVALGINVLAVGERPSVAKREPNAISNVFKLVSLYIPITDTLRSIGVDFDNDVFLLGDVEIKSYMIGNQVFNSKGEPIKKWLEFTEDMKVSDIYKTRDSLSFSESTADEAKGVIRVAGTKTTLPSDSVKFELKPIYDEVKKDKVKSWEVKLVN